MSELPKQYDPTKHEPAIYKKWEESGAFKPNGGKPFKRKDKKPFSIMLPLPNVTGSNAFAFQEEKVFDKGLKDYIDYNLMYEKGFMNNIKLITDPLKWDLTPQEDTISDDEW